MSKRSKASLFGKLYFLYIFLILIFLIVVFFYVRGVLVDYENSSADKYILSELSRAGANDRSIGEYLQQNCFNEKANPGGDPTQRKKDFYQKTSSANLEVKKNLKSSSSEIYCYDVLADEKPFVSIWMKSLGTVNKLGILNIPTWELISVVYRNPNSTEAALTINEDGKLVYDITIPVDFTLELDGVPFATPKDASVVDIKGFKDFSSYECVPKAYEIILESSCEFEVSASNNIGEHVSCERQSQSGKYVVEPSYSSSYTAEDIVEGINPLYIAKYWIDFMQDDVGGAKHGFEKVVKNCKIIANSPLYEKALAWATNVDITFVSDHNAKTFSGEKVDNCIQYNDKLVSCDVNVDFDVPLTSNGVYLRTAHQNYYNRMFFMYVDDNTVSEAGWYWIGSMALEKTNN